MQVVAGPSGSGKSSLLQVAAAGIDHFNIDDRCAQLSQGTYVGIKPEIRARANAECEAFIARHIESKTSFAVETTLRTRHHVPGGGERQGEWLRAPEWSTSRRATRMSASGA